MLISVIIPNYNYAHYLEQCLESVLESELGTYKIEIIVVDDASTDDSVKVIEKMKSKSRFPICVIKNETNMGVLLCRNRGIAYAQGDFLFFLDSDNYINKDCIKIHTDTLKRNHDATACYAPIQNFMNSTGEYCGLRSNQAFDYQKLLERPYIDAMAMFRKNQLIGVGKYDNKMPHYGWEDYELWLRLGKLDKKAIFIEGKPLSFYRVHELNKSQNYRDDQYNHLVYYLKQKYPIKIMLYQSDTLDSLIQKGYFAQLYFKNINSEYDEKQSVIKEITSGIKEISFKFEKSLCIKQLRFDPLNDYVKTRINSIQLLNQGKLLDIEFKLSSNAIHTENNEYLFDTTDPQVFIDFPYEISVELDEVNIEIEYLQKVTELITTLLKYKNFEIEMSKVNTRILTESLQTSEYLKDSLENKLEEKNLIIQEQAEKIGLQDGLLSPLKKQNEQLLEQFNNMEIQIKRLDSELFTLKKSYTYKLFRLFKTLLLLFHPLKLKTQLKVKLNLIRNIKLLQQSGYFDNDYYLKNNPDVKLTGISAIKHYLLYGGAEVRNPSAKFDSSLYLQQNMDVKVCGMNPLLHYILYGMNEGRSPVFGKDSQIHEPLQIDWDSKNNGIENPDQKHPISVGNKNDNEGRDNSIVRSTHDFIQLIKTEGCYSLEIGPLDKSLLDCSLATVKTLDYLSKEQLVEKYKNEENVCTANIVNVDYVWKGEAYDELIKLKFENVLASHVIEHTPDLIGFLKNVSSILKPKGFLFLIIPDKRFCFDHFREDTLLFEVAYAHQQKLKKPTLHSIIDMHRATAHNDPVKHWKGEHDNKLIAEFLTDFTKPYKQYIEHIEELEKIYIDSHVWKFTSESFEKISNYLFREKVVDLETIKIYPTSSDTLQFYVVMQKMP